MSSVDGRIPRLVYRRKGSGEPLVLIHGLGHHRQAWDPVFDVLAEDFDVIAVDLPGFGESPARPWGDKLSVENFCRDLEANFEQWGIRRPHVVGNSLGGAIALELAARGSAASVTALSPAGFVGTFNRVQTALAIGLIRARSAAPLPVLRALSRTSRGRRLAGLGLYAHPERIPEEAALTDLVNVKYCKGFGRTFARNVFYRFTSAIPVPVTIAWGVHDLVLPFGSAAVALARIPNARLVALADCGHVPMADDPAAVVTAIRDTIRASEGVGKR